MRTLLEDSHPRFNVIGMWEKALLLIEEMRAAGPNTQPNVRSYTAAITACGRAGQWEPAVELHSRLIADGIMPDRFSFNAVIGAARYVSRRLPTFSVLVSSFLFFKFVFRCPFRTRVVGHV